MTATDREPRAFASVDAASLAAFRALFGLLMACAMIRFAAKGWIKELYLDPTYHFSYWGLAWIRPPGALGTYALFAGIGLAAAGIALGWRTRFSALAFALLFAYVELIDKTTYLNHYYFITVASLWLCILPAGKAFSLSGRGAPPAEQRVPAWTLWALRAQVGLVYFFAGIAKANPDWLLRAQPLRIWLNARSDLPFIGPLLSTPLAAYGAGWAGLLFDTTAPFLLLWRRTRPFAFAAVVVFHAATSVLFPIGMFPWIMIASATVFFEPDWPRRAGSSLARWGLAIRARAFPGRVPAGPAVAPSASAAAAVPRLSPMAGSYRAAGGYRAALGAAILLLVWQAAVPLRYLLYPGDVRWNERGYRFSWRVMLVEKLGTVTYTVEDADGSRSEIDPEAYVTPLQNRMMAYAPDMIQQCAGWIAEDLRRKGRRPVAIYADARVTLNGKPSRTLVDPSANLLKEPLAAWVKDYPGK
ncbi:MAG TPA: HTTM domain-containing protein [Fibrobacteria bacterium]|nr:HTTM domain-containing protein [Fibrobacteria bacterium]